MGFLRRKTQATEEEEDVVDTATSSEEKPPEENVETAAEDVETAVPPEEDEGMEIQLGTFEKSVALEEQYNEEESKKRKIKLLALLVLFLALLAVLFLVLGLTVWSGEDTTTTDRDEKGTEDVAPTVAPSSAPTSFLFGYILSLLLPYTPREVLLDDSTPQGKAFLQLVSESEAIGQDPDPFRVVQRYSLMTLFFSTNGDGWLNRLGWNGFLEEECFWFGISTCRRLSNGNLAVTNLELAANNLDGPLPTEACILGDYLEKFSVRDNALVGSIPSCLVEYPSLEVLDMSANSVSGGLPVGLLKMPALETVFLHQNQLSGSLDVMFDSLDGVATNLTSANTLKTLRLDQNKLTGTVPDDLASFSQLETLLLNDNELVGQVSQDVCLLTEDSLESFVVDCLEVTCGCCPDCATTR